MLLIKLISIIYIKGLTCVICYCQDRKMTERLVTMLKEVHACKILMGKNT